MALSESVEEMEVGEAESLRGEQCGDRDGAGFGRVVAVGAMHAVHVMWINHTPKFSF